MNPLNEILIYGDIGFEVQAKDIVAQLNECEGPINVRVDSFGGDVYAGISILNALRRYPDVVTVYVDGMAASAASFIAVGGADRLIMSPNSSLLIHGAWSQGMGNSEEMAQLASDLNQITENLATIYAEKTGQEPSYWRELMKQDTTFTAEQAVEAGLADAVAEFEKSARAEKHHAVMASGRSRFAKHAGGRGVPDIETRAAAPPLSVTRSESGDNSTKPSDGQEGDAMSIKNLAQELGVEPDVLREKLSGFFNEEVTVTATVDLTYPENNSVVPTGEVQVAPNEDVPAGVTFELAGTPDGWAGEVAEDTGVLKVTAPANVEPDTEVQFTVSVNGGSGEPVELTVPVTVEAAANTEEETTQETAPETSAPAEDTITLDAETYAELKAAAQHGWKAMEQQKEASLVAEVDGWIKEGRISAARRTKAIAAMKRDAEAARDIYGSNPAGTIPRAEIGYGKDAEPDEAKTVRAKADKVGFLTRKNFH